MHNRVCKKDLGRTGKCKGEKDMLDMIRYEEMMVKAVLSFGVAIAVVLCGIFMLGIELTSCNPLILAGGVSVVALIIWLISVIKL